MSSLVLSKCGGHFTLWNGLSGITLRAFVLAENFRLSSVPFATRGVLCASQSFQGSFQVWSLESNRSLLTVTTCMTVREEDEYERHFHPQEVRFVGDDLLLVIYPCGFQVIDICLNLSLKLRISPHFLCVLS